MPGCMLLHNGNNVCDCQKKCNDIASHQSDASLEPLLALPTYLPTSLDQTRQVLKSEKILYLYVWPQEQNVGMTHCHDIQFLKLLAADVLRHLFVLFFDRSLMMGWREATQKPLKGLTSEITLVYIFMSVCDQATGHSWTSPWWWAEVRNSESPALSLLLCLSVCLSVNKLQIPNFSKICSLVLWAMT